MALLAEFLLAGILLGYGWFSPYRLVLLVLFASQSLSIRGLRWANPELARPSVVWRAAPHAILAAIAILVTLWLVIVPVAVSVTGVPVDVSSLEPIRGNLHLLGVWLAQAWTLAASGEEMVFRGYLIRRMADLGRPRANWPDDRGTGDRATGRVVVELSSGILFAFPISRIPALRRATRPAVAAVTVSGSGSTLSWEALDVDLSVAGLLLSAVEPRERARHLASLAGRATSPAKAAAARANGQRGGRPRKTAV